MEVSTHPTITTTMYEDLYRVIPNSYVWTYSYAGSDGTTRDESNAQKVIAYESGNTNQGASYFITPEGQKITLTWTADENGFVPKGDHLPTPPPIPAEIAAMLPTLPKLAEEQYAKPAYP